jgi:hypothetical protein
MPRTFHELRHTNGNNIEAMVMYGLTDKQPDELTSLNRSWNFVTRVSPTYSHILFLLRKRCHFACIGLRESVPQAQMSAGRA